ncbi:restriction endonuclease [Ramlibacter algicola]|uniref:Restriction endonuclease n=1 Tax=Ramlibacter algicola TaxID=2795217 RepID=A0A934Q0E7_9BURK|nr:restriction endonuclease [Ramlibacter algicola]MBK0392773.1 restriction endonuclease [Ramlibacter algicola]
MARRTPKQKHFSGFIKDKAVNLMVMSGALFGASLLLGGSTNPMLRGVALGFRTPVLYALALAGLLWVIGHLARPKDQLTSVPNRAAKDPESFPNVAAAPGKRLVNRADDAAQVPVPARAWSAQVLDDIEWKRFETLCAQLFAQAGFEAKTQSHGADGGVDIWLHSRNAVGPVTIVQCKHWSNKPVGVKEVRELLGVMTSHKLARGTFATSGIFTKDAMEFAKANNIHTLDGDDLLALIAKRTPEQQEALLQHAYEGEYWRPTCASCGTKLVERTKRNGGAKFWGCASYPRCKTTMAMKATA